MKLAISEHLGERPQTTEGCHVYSQHPYLFCFSAARRRDGIRISSAFPRRAAEKRNGREKGFGYKRGTLTGFGLLDKLC